MYKLTKPQKLIYDMEKFAGGSIAVVCGSVIMAGRREMSDLSRAVKELYRINDALRTHIIETDDGTMQTVLDFSDMTVEVLRFANKAELDAYAEKDAGTPLNLYGNLCQISVVLLPEYYGILVKLHHIIGDAWTISLIGTQFYAILGGETPQAHAYEEYAASEAEYLQSTRCEKDRAFFLDQFRRCDEVTYISEKPTDSFLSRRRTFVIEPARAEKIKAYVRDKGTSAFVLFMTALAAYISRMKMNAEKFYIGTAVLNRSNAREKRTMGMFVNTVPMLVELDSGASFAGNLDSVQKSAFSILRHQKYNYGDVLADIRQEYGFADRLYDVMLSYQNATISADGKIESTWYHSGAQSESLQIHIDDRDGEAIFKIHYDYQTEKFTEREIDRLHEHICNLLFDAIENDGKKLYELALISTDERQKLLYDFNDTAADYPRDKCVHTLFEEQAARTPDKTAVIACDKSITFAELNEQANRIAHALMERGVQRGDIVAFSLSRKSYLIPTIFGILKAGAAYLPLDIDYPTERIEYVLQDSGAKLHITDDSIVELLKNDDVSNLTVSVSPDDLCYCIYTSGTTGDPKGVLTQQRNLVNFCAVNAVNTFQRIVTDDHVFLSTYKACFDAFGADYALPLLHGNTVVIVGDDDLVNSARLAELIRAHAVDVIQTTPSVMRVLCEDAEYSSALKDVKALVIAAEQFMPELYHALKRKSDAVIFNGYGPSETTIGATYSLVESDDITIGKPIANTQIYIVDKYMQPVPFGVTGELCIAGDGVGAGYLNRPELTAEKFIDNPFGAGKLYKTGDLAYWRKDGNIAYVGRNDFQVKIRGLRIELGEIESAISALDSISQAVVVVRKNDEGRQIICAFYTGEALPAQEIRSAISKRLPKYMVPHIFTHIDEMPLTASGKINRNALPDVDLYTIDSTVEYVAPETEKEKALAAAMESVLMIDKVGLEDNFLDLGGDSLKAIELITKLEDHGHHTTAKAVITMNTVRELAGQMTEYTASAETVMDFTGDIPATPAQMRVYTAQAMQGGTAYNVPYVFRAESVDPDRLQNAVQALASRHEILRTRFEDRDGQIVQIVEPEISIQIERLESEDISSFVRPFDLSKAPLLRAGYYENTVMVDMHHIICDGGSIPVFFRELNELYMGRELKVPAVQYRQFAMQQQDYTESEAYWLSVFSDELPELEINTDFKRGQTRSYRGDAIYDEIDESLHRQILSKCKALNITPYVFYMAGFNILLSKFSGNEDIGVGMPVSGREGMFLNTMGMFVNTVALRTAPIGTKTVREFLSEVGENSLAALEHQDYPFGELVRKLGLTTANRNPLFDVMFAYQSEQMTGIIFGGTKAELLPIPVTTAKYDLTFNIMPRGGNVVIMAEYCTDLYKTATVQRFIDGYKQLLTQMLESDMRLSELSGILPEEQKKLLVDFNSTAADYPRDKYVHTLFEEQAARTPDKTAVIACDWALTYRELNEQANRIAHALMERGVQRGDIIGIKLTRKSYLISAMFGVLKSAAAYVPIDPDYPLERVNYILNESQAKYCIDEDNVLDLLENLHDDNPNLSVNGDDIFCSLHTSGSTGTPKLSLLRHGGISNFIAANKRFWKDVDTVVSTTIVTFDAFQMDTVLSVAQGIQLVLSSEDEIYNQARFEQLFLHSKRNMFFSTPTKIENYIDHSSNTVYLGHIRSFVIGGEVFSEALLDKIKTASPDSAVFNIYGPTETTICATVYELENGKDITIGKPIANTQIYIVDKYMQPVPIGVTGELGIAGDGVGAGYLNRPELTAEKFIDNPFGAGKLYKTGDLAYWRADGNIAYIGRNDFQVKIRGLRIELGEIESAISVVDGVSQAVVVVRKNDEGRQLICAFYTGAEIPAQEIRSFIGKRLPKYMVPHIFTHIDEMPLTASGKINRNALPDVDLYAFDSTVEYIAPGTEKEKALAAVMESVLMIDKIGLEDNFLDLGGDSLKAIELITELEDRGYQTTVKAVITMNTLRELATQMTEYTASAETVMDFTGDIPATPAQMRVYTAQAMQGGTAYNVPYAFRAESIDPDRLQNAAQALVDRHEILRTRFEDRDGCIMQVIEPTLSVQVEPLESADISAFVRPFDLSKAPLLRVGYYENTVMVDMHHIICDGGSISVFFRELNELYMGRELKTPAVQYRQFAMLPQEHTKSETYWLSVYSDELPELEINTDFKRGRTRSYQGDIIYDKIAGELHGRILDKCKALNITPYVFYMAGFNILLSKFSGNEDIIVGMPVSGREGRFMSTIGMLVNTVALRSRPEGTKTVAAFLSEVKADSIAAIEHQDYPYGELVKKLGLNTTERNPLFDVMFAYQSAQTAEVVFGDKKADILPVPVTVAKYDFTFNVIPQDAGAIATAEYCTELYSEKTIRRLMDGYKLVLEQMLDETVPLKDISAITERERNALLVDFNDTAADYPRNKCVHALFEEQAARTPDKTAVIACDRTLNYRGLNEQANRIAHALMERGVQRGDIVAFALPRTSNMIAAMLGILKAGAAYLPVDPDYPQERIDYMLSDSGARLFITGNNISDFLDNESVENPDVSMTSRDLCYCIYTSGSTGRPKGTLLRHRNLVNLVTDLGIYHDLSKYERIGFMTTITFDVASQEIFTGLLNGFTGVLMPERRETLPDDIIAGIKSHEIDVIYATPTYLNALTDTEEKARLLLESVKVVVLAGEEFSLNRHVTALRDSYGVVFENQYGPAETNVVTAAAIGDTDDVHIGKPIANTQIYIVDKYMRPVPIGMTGELCIAGDGVGAGYLNRPELTAEKFIDNPFGAGKLYKTGDLAYWREDGNIAYVGRNDFQVKIRGQRIELGEIESAMSALDGISQSVVVVRKNTEGRQLICAFYTGTEMESGDIRGIIGKHLPKYMLPHIFVHIENMPLTASGKINRKALPKVDLSNIISGVEYVAPVTETQKILCALAEEVLGVSPVGLTDNFFDLGGDSLKAIEFVSKAHHAGIYFSLQGMYNTSTMGELAEYIESGDKDTFSLDDTDFTAANRILAKNKVEYIYITMPQKTDVGNILLTGATGFLGAHILADYLDNDSGVAYCLVRGQDDADAERRLADRLRFYFGDKYVSSPRIHVICADLEKLRFGLDEEAYEMLQTNVTTVINAAASVKHYGSYEFFYKANVETVKRLIAFCMDSDTRLIHISTTGVSGKIPDDGKKAEVSFSESELYIGQSLDNVYARSKFEAEKTVLDAMNEGLSANIMRMGNLTNRYSDGMFQPNYETNDFWKHIRATLALGVYPDYLQDHVVEFTPIDEAAHAVMLIARHFSAEQTVFHIENNRVVYIKDLCRYFTDLGFPVVATDGGTFAKLLRDSAVQPAKAYIHETFINDMDDHDRLNYGSIHLDTEFTTRYLNQLSFEWSEIRLKYLRKYVEYFRDAGYFEN